LMWKKLIVRDILDDQNLAFLSKWLVALLTMLCYRSSQPVTCSQDDVA